MNDQESLIARKQEILRELTRARRQLEGVRLSSNPHQRRQRQQLEREMEQMMAEECRLRIAIDRSQ